MTRSRKERRKLQSFLTTAAPNHPGLRPEQKLSSGSRKTIASLRGAGEVKSNTHVTIAVKRGKNHEEEDKRISKKQKRSCAVSPTLFHN